MNQNHQNPLSLVLIPALLFLALIGGGLFFFLRNSTSDVNKPDDIIESSGADSKKKDPKQKPEDTKIPTGDPDKKDPTVEKPDPEKPGPENPDSQKPKSPDKSKINPESLTEAEEIQWILDNFKEGERNLVEGLVLEKTENGEKPVMGAKIRGSNYSGKDIVSEALTNEKGEFSLSLLAIDRYRLRVFAGASMVPDVEVFGGTPKKLKIILETGRSWEGKVLDSATQDPVTEFKITIFSSPMNQSQNMSLMMFQSQAGKDETMNPALGWSQEFQSTDGSFLIQGLRGSANGFGMIGYLVEAQGYSRITGILRGGRNSSVIKEDILLGAEGMKKVRILEVDSNKPIVGATIETFMMSALPLETISTQTDSKGYAEVPFKNMEFTRQYRVSHRDYAMHYFSAFEFRDQEEPIIYLGKGAKLFLKVQDESGKGIEKAWVRFSNGFFNMTTLLQGETDNKGEFDIPAYSAGSYNIEAFLPAPNPLVPVTRLSKAVTLLNGEDAYVTLETKALALLSGNIQFGNLDMTGAQLRLGQGNMHTVGPNGTVREGGVYEITGVEPGEYEFRLRAFDDNIRVDGIKLNLAAGKNTFNLDFSSFKKFHGKVLYAADGAPAKGASLRFNIKLKDGTSVQYRVLAGADGSYSVFAPAGECVLNVEKHDGKEGIFSFSEDRFILEKEEIESIYLGQSTTCAIIAFDKDSSEKIQSFTIAWELVTSEGEKKYGPKDAWRGDNTFINISDQDWKSLSVQVYSEGYKPETNLHFKSKNDLKSGEFSVYLEKGGGVIKGKLLDEETGKPIAGQLIRLGKKDFQAYQNWGRTEADGSFSFTGLPNSAMKLMVELPNYEKLELEIEVTNYGTFDLQPIKLTKKSN